MAREDKILMSVKALRRLHAIHQVMEKKLGQVEAGRLLGRTDRQVRRIVKRVREAGDELIQFEPSPGEAISGSSLEENLHVAEEKRGGGCDPLNRTFLNWQKPDISILG